MQNGTIEGRLNVKLLYETLARLLSEAYNAKLTVTVRRRDEKPGPKNTEEERPIAV